MQPVQVGLFIGLVASFGRLNRYRRQSHEDRVPMRGVTEGSKPAALRVYHWAL